jgi:hypothetical protein
MQQEVDIEQCVRTVQILCLGEEPVELSQALSTAMAEREEREQEKKLAEEAEEASRRRAQELEAVSQVSSKCGDMFDKDCISEALAQENWDPNKAMDRLFDEYNQADRELNVITPALNVQKLLEASRAANAARKGKEVEHTNALPPRKTEESDAYEPSENVMKIRDVFALALAKGAKLQLKEEQAKISKTFEKQSTQVRPAGAMRSKKGLRLSRRV